MNKIVSHRIASTAIARLWYLKNEAEPATAGGVFSGKANIAGKTTHY